MCFIPFKKMRRLIFYSKENYIIQENVGHLGHVRKSSYPYLHQFHKNYDKLVVQEAILMNNINLLTLAKK